MNCPPSICPELASARGLKVNGIFRPQKKKLETRTKSNKTKANEN